MPAAVDRPETALVRRARKVNRVLAETYPDAHCELDFENPFQLLVATIMSAQTTDRRVNSVTPALFAKYPDAFALAAADREDVENIIKPTGFFRAKANSIQLMAADLADRFNGEVPGRMKDLVTLHGVGRKTANVVLGEAFGNGGVTVDTHMARLARRLGWVSAETAKNPVKAEHEIGALFPRKELTLLNHRVIWHGRRICHARKPACGVCVVARWCPSFGEGPTDPELAEKLVRTEGWA